MCTGFNNGFAGGGVSRSGTKQGTPVEDLILGYALSFKGVTGGPNCDPPLVCERVRARIFDNSQFTVRKPTRQF
jgi:hypothetical protein